MEPLDFFIYNCFGFNWWPSGPVYRRVDDVSKILDQPAWNQVLRTLAAEPADPPLVQDEYKAPIADFVHLMLASQSLPGALWDLSDSNEHPLHTATPAHHVILHNINGSSYYFIEPHDSHPSSEQHWTLVTPSAAAVLECIRREMHLQDHVIQYFLDHGIACSTRLCRALTTSTPTLHLPPIDHRLHHDVGLGWRPPNYKPDSIDYASYEVAHDALLSQPHACAALLHGGIVWHPARESITNDNVLIGPTEDVFMHGDILRTENQEFWDDKLTDQDIDVICGVYKVFTGMF